MSVFDDSTVSASTAPWPRSITPSEGEDVAVVAQLLELLAEAVRHAETG